MGRWVVVLVALSAALSGCASAGGPEGGSSAQSSSRVLTADELAGVSELNCFEAVERLRPAWLRTRGRVSYNSQQGVRIYVNRMLRGYAPEMAQIRTSNVERMQYLSAPEATSRFGTDHVDGAIMITLKGT
jgi:hypothetical protein